MDLKEKEWSGMDLFDLAQDRDNWRTFVKTFFEFHKMMGIS
jgi:hypothetical protein